MSDTQRINCMNCRFYFVTWDPNFPRGCKAYEFKTRSMPSAAVLSSSGQPCMKFQPKSNRQKG